MKTRFIIQTAVIASSLLMSLVQSAHAQIAVAQTLQVPGNGGINIVQAFTVNQPETVLVVGLYQDGETINYVRFGDGGGVGSGDQAADLILTEGRAAAAYFVNPSTNSGLSIRIGNGADGFIGAWVLSGTDLSQPPETSTGNSITTTEDDMFIVSWATKNGDATITPDNGSMSTNLTLFQGGSTGSGVGGSLAAATAGAYNVGWTGDDELYGPFTFAFATPPVGLVTFSSEAASSITTNAATVSAQLIGTDADVTAYWEEGSVADPASHTGWDGTNGPSAESVGAVSRGASNLVPDTLYSFAFYGTNNTTKTEGWSQNAGTFSSAFSDAQAPTFSSVSQVNEHSLKVALTWQTNATYATAYLLQRATDGGSFATVASIAADTVTYTDVVATVGQHIYRLAATNSSNGSATDFTLCETNITVTVPFGVAQLLQVIPVENPVNEPFQVQNEGSVLVVGFYSDALGSTSIEFGGQAADGAVVDDRGSLVYFLDPPTNSGLSIIETSGKIGFVAAWELAGIDLAGLVVTSLVDTITTPDDEMFIVSWGYANSGALPYPSAASNVERPIDIESTDAGGSSGTGAGGSTFAQAAGVFNVGWENDGVGSPLAFAFTLPPSAPAGTVFTIR